MSFLRQGDSRSMMAHVHFPQWRQDVCTAVHLLLWLVRAHHEKEADCVILTVPFAQVPVSREYGAGPV